MKKTWADESKTDPTWIVTKRVSKRDE